MNDSPDLLPDMPLAPQSPAAAAARATPDVAAIAPLPMPAPRRNVTEPFHAAREASNYVTRMFTDMRTADAALAEDLAESSDASISAPTQPVPTESPSDVVQGLMAGQQVLVLGLGISGLSMVRWCVRCGAQVTVADTRENPALLERLRAEVPQARFVAGPLNAALVDQQALNAVYRSPGLTPSDIGAVAIAAAGAQVVVGGELGLYADALSALSERCAYEPSVLAITGTNGKTTVTALTGMLLESGGATVAVAGNIGPALLDTLAAHLDAGTLPSVWVLELSSFQLDAPSAFLPTAATVLNLSQDHLDWHGNFAAYADAKARVFGPSGLMVLNREDPAVMAMHIAAGSAPVAPSAPLDGLQRVKAVKPTARAFVSFGGDMPKRPGDFGIEVVNGMAWLVRAQEADETRKRSPRRAAPASGVPDEELFIQRLMPVDALRIRGRHNAVNALAALALAQAAGGALGTLLYALREYRGEPHRVEPVGVVDNVEFFDDSKGTNVGATVAAISGLGVERRVVVILGGLGKGQDFSPLAVSVAQYARAVVLMGRDAPLIREALQSTAVPLLEADSLQAAVDLAAERAHAGDAVLLSPACASFDMFNGYEHRGDLFCDMVRARANGLGQALEGPA